VLAMRARDLLQRGELPQRTIVATVMSNIGLERALDGLGISLVRTPVGDRYVLEEMQKTGHRLGGEQSGHIIDLQANTTGDGIATAVAVATLAKRHGRLADLATIMQRHPQVLVNVTVADKVAAQADAAVRSAVDAVMLELGKEGRILVRPSGTEPLIRVMIEGQDEQRIRALAQRVADAIKNAAQQEA
jgi:phosphoglucosamine mutase